MTQNYLEYLRHASVGDCTEGRNMSTYWIKIRRIGVQSQKIDISKKVRHDSKKIQNTKKYTKHRKMKFWVQYTQNGGNG